MKKLIVFLLALVCVLGLTGCSKDPLAKKVQVFDTENITRITFYTECDGDTAFEVPDEYMEQITTWLGTFTISKVGKVSVQPQDQAAGTNSTSVKIEYLVIENGLDTTWYDGAEYEMLHDNAPECYDEIFQ